MRYACSLPRGGFWLIHILGPLFIFMLGARFATRRVPVIPLLAFRIFRMLRER